MIEPGTLIAMCIGIGAIMASLVTATAIVLAPMVPSSDEHNEKYKKHARNSVPYPYTSSRHHSSSAALRRL